MPMLSSIQTSLKEIVGNQNVLLAEEDLLTYSYDATSIWSHLPEVVVLPQTSQQVSQILKLANDSNIPVTARGGGTNLSGGSIPIKGGIVLCMTKMNRIISISKATLVAEVEPGVVMQDFQQALAKEGLFYPPDPQSAQGCTLGGTVAENAGGPYGVKYGVTKQYLLGLQVVLANGEIVSLGSRTIKNRMGYELVSLFAGSEGTLGIITRITLRLLSSPESQKTMLAVFESMEKAGEAVSEIINAGIVPAKIEFVDNWFIRRIENLTHMGLPVNAEALLLVQSDGYKSAVEREIEGVIRICSKIGAKEARSALDPSEADRLWQLRKSAFAAIYSSAPTILSDDITVPRDKIALLIKKCYEIGKKYDFDIHFTGHAGDGNIHPSIQTDIKDKENFERALKAIDEMVEATMALGGVASGEHGIGLEKKRYMQRGVDPIALRIMRDIKKALDPKDILNPGKYWEDQV
jgi:glycolate oxidase